MWQGALVNCSRFSGHSNSPSREDSSESKSVLTTMRCGTDFEMTSDLVSPTLASVETYFNWRTHSSGLTLVMFHADRISSPTFLHGKPGI